MSTPVTTPAPPPSQQDSITHAVTRIFCDLKRDMDTIVNSAGLDSESPTAAAGPLEQQLNLRAEAAAQAGDAEPRLPLLRLSHRRTESEAPGYDDYQLPNPIGKLPEVLDADEASTELQIAAPAVAAAAGRGSPTRSSTAAAKAGRSHAHAGQGMPAQLSSPRQPRAPAGERTPTPELQQELRQLQEEVDRAGMLMTAPAVLSGGASGRSASLESSDGGAGYPPGSSRQLSYKELLDRALAWNPRVKGAGPYPTSTGGTDGSSMRTSIDTSSRRVSTVSTASGSTTVRPSGRQRPSSTGRMQSAARTSGFGVPSPPDYRSKLHYLQQSSAQRSPPQHSRSKFPASGQHSSHFSLSAEQQGGGHPWCSAAAGSRMFREMATVGEAGMQAPRRMGGMQERSSSRPKALYRSRSAPREEAATRRHIERMHGSPTRAAVVAAVAGRESILGSQQQQQAAVWSGQRDRSRHISAGSSRSSAAFSSPNAKKSSARSPDAQLPMRLTDDEWDRVTTRLHQYTAGRLKHAGVTDRSSFAAGPRSTSTSPDRLAAAAPLNPDFYRRQNRLLQKRAELAASKRRSDEDDLTECTFHPQINPSSRNLQRSVQQLHAWDARRKLTVFAKALDKCEHEGEGYSFMPTINPLSRQLALANYAVAPDPSRPWTKPDAASTNPRRNSPRRNSPSPDAMRMLRDALPPANVIMMAGPTAQQKVESVMDLLGGVAAAPPASARHYGHSSTTSIPTGADSPQGRHSPHLGLEAVTVYADSREQQQGQEEEWEGAAGAHYGRSNAASKGGSQQAGADAGHVAALGSDTVLGMPADMPALGMPVGTEAASCRNSSEAEDSEEPSSGVDAEGGAGDGSIVIRLTAGQQLEKTSAHDTAVSASPATAAPAADKVSGKGQAAHSGQKEVLEPQLLLAALKLTPVQAQQGLEEGRSRVSANGTAPQSAAVAAVRGSSSGGMAPGTPVMGSLGGSGVSGGGGNISPFAKPGLSPMRDDSAAGIHARGTKPSAEGSPLAHKPVASSPLSRSQQQQGTHDPHNSSPKGHAIPATAVGKDCDNHNSSSSPDATLQDLAQHWGCAGDKVAQQLRAAGLQTVPAYFYAAADARSPPPAIETVKRPSSYSQKYQQRLSNSAGSDRGKQGLSPQGHDTTSNPAVPPELLDMINSLAAAGGMAAVRGSSSSGGGYSNRRNRSSGGGNCGSPPDSPTFAQLKARWMAKESASRESSGAGAPRSGYSSPTKTSAAGALPGASAGGFVGPDAALAALGSSLVAGPETPMHGQQQQSPFTAPAGTLAKQYSTAQLLNARARHSSAGGGYPVSAHAFEEQQQQQAGSAVATLAGHAESQVVVLLTSEGADITSQDTQSSASANGALAACSSVISVPDAATGAAAAAAAESCNGCPRAMVTQKVEVLLEGTRSVPFELVLSPRSKGLLALTYGRGRSTSGGSPGPTCVDIATPLGQHLMQLLSSGRASQGGGGAAGKGPLAVTLSVAQWQQLQQQHEQQQQVATAVPLSPVGVPVLSGGSPAVDAVAQLLSSPADRHSSSGGSIRSNNSSTGGAPSHAPTAAIATGGSAASAASVNGPSMQPGSNERLIMQLLRPCAASPFLLRSNAGTPVWGTPSSSRVGLSTLQQQQQLASAPISSNPCDSTTSCAASGPAAAAGAAVVSDTAASAAGTPQQQLQQQSDEAVDLAAELVVLLQSAGSMSPEEKADRVARTFAKTISRLNMSSDVLQQTIATLSISTTGPAPNTSSSSGGSPAAPAAIEQAPTLAVAASTAAAAAPAREALDVTPAGLSGLDDSDMSGADNMQQLLERMSKGGLLISPASTAPQLPQQQQQQQGQNDTVGVRVTPPASPGATAASATAAAASSAAALNTQSGSEDSTTDSHAPAAAAAAAAGNAVPEAVPAAVSAAGEEPAGAARATYGGSPAPKSWANIVATRGSCPG